MGSSQKSVKEFALIGFLLLAVLFGMQIMTFIFGNIGATDFLADDRISVINESGAYVNDSGYTVAGASVSGFSGGVTATAVWVNVSGVAYILPAANYSLSSAGGVLINLTHGPNETQYADANVSYTYNRKTESERVSDEVTNDSLRAIGSYAEQSGTQFTTLGIAITLIILVAVFLFFWKAFMGKKGEGPGGGGGFS